MLLLPPLSARFPHLHKQVDPRAFRGGPVVSVCLPMQGTQVPPLVLERRPPMPWGNEDHGQQPLVLVPPLEGRPTCHSKDPACRNSDLLQPKMNIKQTKPKQEKDPSRFQKPVQRRQPPPVSQQTGDFRPRVPCSVTLTASFSLPWLWLLCSPPRLPCREVRAPGCRPGSLCCASHTGAHCKPPQ